MHILVINSGSSSIKFSVFEAGAEPALRLTGEITGIGAPDAHFSAQHADGQPLKDLPKADAGHDPLSLLVDTVTQQGMPDIDAVGYRVVHPGRRLHEHQRITNEVMDALREAVAFAPLHDPAVITLIEQTTKRFPSARHYACFDTVFHQTLPPAASTYPIPAKFREQGVRRYGFHGLSCESVVKQLRSAAEQGALTFPSRSVIAHLGSGCSLTALVDGQSVDTTMGLTPTGGVVMGTRPGDLDPGLVLYLLRTDEGGADSVTSVEKLLNHDSGMVALSGLPNDMRKLRKADSAEARLALEVFTRSVRKAIGSYAWLLGGLDALIFAGGIGEHDALSRQEILAGVEGLELDEAANQAPKPSFRRISQQTSPISVWIVPAQEDCMIAEHVLAMEHQS